MEMKKRILKSLESYLATNREVMSMEEIDDLVGQIDAIKASIAMESIKSDGMDGNNDTIELMGFIFCHGKDDYEYWEVTLPELVQNQIMDILKDYDTWGCSIRDSVKGLCEEFMREKQLHGSL